MKGSEEMNTPTTSELLVQVTREAEQRKLYQLAQECETLEEFKSKLRQIMNK